VLPTGEIIRTKPLFKTSTGYDIVSLFVGSEGTLGVITEVTLKLIPRPRNRRITSYVFGSFDSGLQAINEIQKTTMPDFFTLTELSFLKYSKCPAEFIVKNLNSKFISWYVKSKYIEKKGHIKAIDKLLQNFPHVKTIVGYIDDTLQGKGCLTLLRIGFEGEKDIISHKNRIADRIAKSFGGFKFEDTSGHEKRFTSHLELFKEVIFEQFQEYSQNFRIATFDISSPPSKVLEVKKLIHGLLKNYSTLKLLDIELFSSIGNIDFEVIFPSDDGDSYFKFLDELNTSLLKLGCSLSFAHGVGTRFLPYLNADIGEEQLKVMQRIKKAMDPKNILNPGKIGGQR
jgi:FAD/FMN-containing dehydrogenase